MRGVYSSGSGMGQRQAFVNTVMNLLRNYRLLKIQLYQRNNLPPSRHSIIAMYNAHHYRGQYATHFQLHPSWFDQTKNICSGEKILLLLNMQTPLMYNGGGGENRYRAMPS